MDARKTHGWRSFLIWGIAGLAAVASPSRAGAAPGQIDATGNDTFGQMGIGEDTWSPIASSITSVSGVAGGAYHSVAVTSDGTVWAWGYNSDGQLGDGTLTGRTSPVQVTGLTGCTAAAAGEYFSLARKSDGTLRAWGDNAYGQLGDGTTTDRKNAVQVSVLTNVSAVAAGGSHCLALKSDGTVWAWGYNSSGQVGDGSTTNRTAPVHILSLSGVLAIGAGRFHSLAVKSDGTVWAWGSNTHGQLGDGTTTQRTSPVQVGTIAGATAAAGGYYHSMVLKSDGTVWAWGDNTYGQLGDGTYEDRTTAVEVVGLAGATRIAAGATFSFALRTGGEYWAWGDNGRGQLGDGTTESQPAPVEVAIITGVSAVAGGLGHTIAVKTDGTVWSWGLNENGQLGNGTTSRYTTPRTISGLTMTQDVVVGYQHCVAMLGDGTVWTWGKNASGQLGDGTVVSRSEPVQVPDLVSVAGISAGQNHSLAAKSDGTVWAWGDNTYGQLGDGTTTSRQAPVQVSGLADVIGMAGGKDHSLAVKSDGTVWAWGDNYYGQLGNGTTTDSLTPVQVTGLSGVQAVAAGACFSYALKANGTVWAWGYNYYGQLGDATTTDRHAPVQASGLTNIISVAAGYQHGLALKNNNRLYAWGYNLYGQIGDGTTTTRYTPVLLASPTSVAAIAAGDGFSLAAKSDGTAWSWGRNAYGQLGDGTTTSHSTPAQISGLTGVAKVAAGSQNGMFLGEPECWPVPTIPVNAQAIPPAFCSAGLSAALTAQAGTGGDQVEWFVDGCGATGVPGGASPVVSPTVTTTYYARTLNTSTGCVSPYCKPVTIPVSVPPTPPDSVLVDRADVCAAVGNIALSAQGGSGEGVHWYTGSCGTTGVGTGNPLTIAAPSETKTYYGRWESPCGISTCANVTVTVHPLPSGAPTAPTATPAGIETGSTSQLSATPGTGGDSVEWYIGSCSGTAVPSGGSPTVSPTATTTYYARTKNTATGCLSASCASVTVTVTPPPTPPDSASVNRNNICAGDGNIILTATGGSGTAVHWYAGSCGTTAVGTGSPLTKPVPSATMTYYARWETAYSQSTCASVTVAVYAMPGAPTGAAANPPAIERGWTSQLSALPGSGGDNIEWFTGSCGGTAVVGGASPTVSPTVTTTYYARTKNMATGCVSAACASITITITAPPTPPTSASVNRPDICQNDTGTVILTSQGGSGTAVHWYTGGCGTTPAGVGNPLTIAAPTVTTTYYARWETIHSVSTCVDVTVTVDSPPIAPDSAAVDRPDICAGVGGNIILTAQGGNGDVLRWYTGACGTTAVGTGTPLTLTAPTSTKVYYARWTNTCGVSTCASTTVAVHTPPSVPLAVAAIPAGIVPGMTSQLFALPGSGGDTVEWFTGSCGGTVVPDGASPTVSPTATTKYYVRTKDSVYGCVSGSCANVTVTVTAPPDSVTMDRPDICEGAGGNIILTAHGGSGEILRWFSGSCGTGALGTGNPLTIPAPSVTTTYFARWDTAYGVSPCASVTVTVDSPPIAADSASVDRPDVCQGDTGNIMLTAQGGAGDIVHWYVDGCGTTSVGIGNPLTIPAPSMTKTYYARWATACGESACVSAAVTVHSSPGAPGTPTANPARIQLGGSSLLSAFPTTVGSVVEWFTSSCGGTAVPGGSSPTVSPEITTTYYVRTKDTTTGCVSANCLTVNVTVDTPVLAVTPANQNVGCLAGSTTFTVSNTGDGSLAYTSATSDSWLHIASGGSNTVPPDSGLITVNVDANPGALRVGTITVTATGVTGSPAYVTVSQDPGPCCSALAISSAVSQKTHGTSGTYDTSSGGVEGRLNGPTQIAVTFNQPVHRVSSDSTDFALSSGTLGTVTVAGAIVSVNASGVADQAVFTIGFPGIASDCDNTTTTATQCWEVLAGDVNGIPPVNNFDVLAIRGLLGQVTNGSNYTRDVNYYNGKIDNFDMLFTRGKLGHSVAGACNP